MKHENSLRLARIASDDCRNGKALALYLAGRMYAITGSLLGDDIVSRVYCCKDGKAVFPCRECGSEHLTSGDAAACCSMDD